VSGTEAVVGVVVDVIIAPFLWMISLLDELLAAVDIEGRAGTAVFVIRRTAMGYRAPGGG
jgi:hypothetical protein